MSTFTKFVTCEPSGVMHEIVNTVGPARGTVDALPESVLWLKLPSGLVTMHDVTPLEFQNIEVRVPTETEAGTAHTATAGGTAGAAEDGAAVCGLAAGFAAATGTAGAALAGTPARKPFVVQRLSKSDD